MMTTLLKSGVELVYSGHWLQLLMLYTPMAVLHNGEQPFLNDPSLSIHLANQADDIIKDIINLCPFTSPVIRAIIALF